MSGIDKFVLLPHERYVRLIKKGPFEPKEEEEAKQKKEEEEKEEEEEEKTGHILNDNISPQFIKNDIH
jgi:hypothetical protein